MNIPLAKPFVGDDEYAALKPIMESGWLGMGASVGEFERAVSDYIGCKYSLAINTGTNAIHIALEAVGVEGKEVIVPSMTYAATIQAILMAGGTPVFAECREDDLNLDIDDAIARITPKTKVILPVHYAGKSVDMDRLLEIAEIHKLTIIEDAAHAFGSLYKNRKIGSFGHLTCFSFDPIKTITCGEGGAVCTNDKKFADRITHMRVLGISKNTWDRYKSERPWLYDVIDKGFRYHMSNLNAAIGLVQMNKLQKLIAVRKEIAARYDAEFNTLNEIAILEHDLKETVPFCYTIRILNGKRDSFMSYMKECGIGVSILYIPNHQQQFFKKYSQKLPITEKLAEEFVSIPLFAGMLNEEAGYIIEKVKTFDRGVI
jgi:perosamine synthetase